MKKMAPHVILTKEFDRFIVPTNKYIKALRKNGKLLDLFIDPGQTHMT